MAFVTRFAPSPTGPLHLGHAYSAILAHDMARAEGGQFLLRIEDIDQARCRDVWERCIYDDLTWLGLTWDGMVMRQSERMPAYHAALQTLWNRNLLYPCTCRRHDIKMALSAPQEGAQTLGPDGFIYPGTCRWRLRGGRLRLEDALRLDVGKAFEDQTPTGFEETGCAPGHHNLDAEVFRHQIGDFAISRREFETSYHLSVVVDDAAQKVTHVIRGEDLFEATRIHVLLQSLLDLPTPVYHHHRLIRDVQGKRLAKRDDARALSKYRAEGATPANIRRLVGLPDS
jgi:glutamyl-Q tRNA(Asp) synthetase